MFRRKPLIYSFLVFVAVLLVAGGFVFYNSFYRPFDGLGLGDAPLPVTEGQWPQISDEVERQTLDLGFGTIEVPVGEEYALTEYEGAPALATPVGEFVLFTMSNEPPVSEEMAAGFREAIGNDLFALTLRGLRREPISFWAFFGMEEDQRSLLLVYGSIRASFRDYGSARLFAADGKRLLLAANPEVGGTVMLASDGVILGLMWDVGWVTESNFVVAVLPYLRTVRFEEGFTGDWPVESEPVPSEPQP